MQCTKQFKKISSPKPCIYYFGYVADYILFFQGFINTLKNNLHEKCHLSTVSSVLFWEFYDKTFFWYLILHNKLVYLFTLIKIKLFDDVAQVMKDSSIL